MNQKLSKISVEEMINYIELSIKEIQKRRIDYFNFLNIIQFEHCNIRSNNAN